MLKRKRAFQKIPGAMITSMPLRGRTIPTSMTSPHTDRTAWKARMISLTGNRAPVNKGFTLIEILLVLFLLSIVAAVTLPQFSRSYEQLTLQDATNDIAYL